MKTKESPDAATSFACADNGDPSWSTEFEVFLSFRGPDTRLNLADCLYHFLVGAGIRVFRDNEEIRKGERIEGELLRAIETSKIYVPIFSRNYASSAWCLRELARMLECLHRANDKVILPIFCGVKTDDVKLKTRLYLDALDKHVEEGRFDVQQWKKALIEVAKFKGWDLQDKGYGEISTAVLDVVSTRLKKRRRNLPDHLVGIHDHVQAILNFLDEGPHDIEHRCSIPGHPWNGRYRSLEICDSVDLGINIIRERFRDKKVLLILDDVNKLDQLSKLAGKSDWFGAGSKIIITTRDINFLPITEENKESCFQAYFGEFKIYEMREMDSSHALQLFSKHAFTMNFPPRDFYDISREITSKAGGLPLALEVIGSSLWCKNKKSWEKILKKLDFVPKEEVLNRLEISYDMLKQDQKEMFLDIACFFIGKERLYPYYMWKASKYFPASEVLVLARMSLIKINENDTLWMHDLLRDLGREIVEREYKSSPGKRSRLWQPETAFKVVRMKEGTDKVVALRLRGLSKEHNFTSEQFSKLPNLRFLELEGGNLVGNFENLLWKLRWLSWSDCPSELSAANLCLEDLVVLELSGSNITEDWNGWGSCLVSENLKVIRITQCPSLRRTPDFSKCLNLKKLVFQGCTSMVVVDGSHSKLGDLKLTNSVGGIESLLQLDLSGTATTELLASNGKSKKYLDESEARELPKATGMLEDKDLKAQSWGNMKGDIPSELDVKKEIFLDLASNFIGRERLHLYSGRKASDFPINEEPFRNLKSLISIEEDLFLDLASNFTGEEKPDLYYVRKASDFPGSEVPFRVLKSRENNMAWVLDQLRGLRRVIIRYEGKNYGGKRGMLVVLRIAFNVVLPIREGTDKVAALRRRVLSEVHNFTNEQFSKLQYLRCLELECRNLVRTYLVGNFQNLLSNLTWLCWSDCPSELSVTNLFLEKSPVLELSGSITEDLNGCGPCLLREYVKVTRITRRPSFWAFSDFSKCLDLGRLVIQGCTTLPVFDGSHCKLEDLMLRGIKKLRQMNIDESEIIGLPKAIWILADKELTGEVQSFPNIIWKWEKELPGCHSFSLTKSMDRCFLRPPIKYWLSYLQKLRLDRCGEVQQFPELPVGLKELMFSSHLLWTALDLSYLTNLIDLQIRRDTLRSLVFRREAPKIEWIEKLPNLERLTIDMGDVQCPRINWASLSRLRSSVIIHWHNIVYVRGVVRVSELLERLSISGLKEPHRLSVFACPGLIKTHGVEKWKSLKAMFIHRSDLSKCKKLRQLNLAHCSLQNLPDLHLPDKCHLMVEGCEVSSAFDGHRSDGRRLCHSVDHINIQL